MYKILRLLFLISIVWGCTQEIKPESSLLYYIPPDSEVVLKIRDLSTLRSDLKNNAFLQKAVASKTSSAISDAVNVVSYLDHPGECLLAFAPDENNGLQYVFVTEKHDSILNKEKIDSTAIIDNGNFSTIEVDGRTIYTSTHQDMLVASSSSQLLNTVTASAGKEEINRDLNSLYKAASSIPAATAIIKVSPESPLSSYLIKEQSTAGLEGFANWLSLDINTGQDHLALNGITLAKDDSTSVLSLFKNTRPLSHKTPLLAPANSLATLSFTFDSHENFAKNQLPFLNSTTALDSVFNTVEEIGFVYLPDEKAVILQTYGTENIADYLENQQSGITDYQGKEIVALKEPRFLNVQFAPLVKNFNANYYTVVENAFVFAQDRNVLQGLIRNYNSGNTLSAQAAYEALEGSMADEAHIQFLSKSQGITSVLGNDLDEAFLIDLKKVNPRQFVYAAQVVADEEFYHTNILINKIAEKARKNTATALFSVQLDDAMATNPQFVVNHRTRQKEIVVQDESNTLYLISNKGKILWKKDIGGRIQGKIQQVDLYKNGRLQLAFTTDSQFYILDRNGKVVAPFSKKFPGGNLNPLAVFDYENNRNYRFVVTQGSKIFMYNSKGNIVEGFTYKEAPSSILHAPVHFRVGKRDYLVFTLENGKLEILNRLGKTRIAVEDDIDFSGNPVFLYNNKFTVSDKKGRLYQYDTKGNKSTTRLNLNEYHGLDATTKSLATMNDNVLTIKGRKKTLELGVYTRPKIFYIYDTIYVSVTDLQSEKVYMYYSNARSLPGFPVYGGSAVDLADMDNDRKLEMVTRDQKESLVVYRLN